MRRSRRGLRPRSRPRGIAAEIADAGVSGDTAANGLARLDWAVPDGTDGVIVALGANDMLRGLDPDVDAQARSTASCAGSPSARSRCCSQACARRPILARISASASRRSIRSSPHKYDALLYPFFLDGVAGDPKLNQRDGIHPSAAGVERMVAGILPKVEELVAASGKEGCHDPSHDRRYCHQFVLCKMTI